MTSLNLSMIPLLLSMLGFLSLTCTRAADPVSLFHFCANSTFSQNSLYNSSLNSLLSYLSSNVIRNIEFYNTTSGQNTSDTLYGLFLCRGDVDSQMCRACVVAATKELAAKCSREKVAVIWFDDCMIRYSNQSIFSTMTVRPRVSLLNTQNKGNITERDRFNPLVSMTMIQLASQASNFPIGVKKFGTNQTTYNEFQNLYSLVQCTPDLSSDDCNICLQAAINRLPICCDGKQGGRVLFPSCNVRYELYPFFNVTSMGPTPTTGPPPSPPPPTGSAAGSKGTKRNATSRTAVAIIVPIFVVIIILAVSIIYLFSRVRKCKDHFDQNDQTMDEMGNLESLQFEFNVIRAATDSFSDANKLGIGGFGPVYKGKLSNGQEIAVKRLSRNSGQGDLEFMNEVLLLAKLQHRNLVRLLGFCLEGNERLLVYEFVPNRSLDHYIFDTEKSANLNWESRYKIIKGIARGLLYLHEDSRLRIIHRDLKAANVLLDLEMNPKISDFGMARMCVLDQTEGSTNRIVGTYGYMAPEYAMLGQFSVKSDVFSFGVLMLEIVSGEKITSCREGEENKEYLLSYAWKNWREGTAANLIDLTLRSGPLSEMVRCIHIGLLCVQANVADRLDMASVVLMLNSNSIALPLPTQPASFIQNGVPLPTSMKLLDTDCKSVSQYEVSISELYPR